MPTSTVTRKGQITIPKEVRDRLGLQTGDRVSLWVREEGVIELRLENVDLMSLRGILKPRVKGVTIEDMNVAIRRAVSQKQSRSRP